LSRQCGFLKPNQERCKGTVREGDTYCWAHDAKYEEVRRRGQARGGKHKPSKELNDVKDRIREMIADVRDDKMDRADAAVCAQLYNSLLKAISIELKLKEQEELIERLEQVEAELETRKRSRPWG
jgi:hypothetical protein